MKKTFAIAYFAVLASLIILPNAALAGYCQCSDSQTASQCTNDDQCKNASICPNNTSQAKCNTNLTSPPASGSQTQTQTGGGGETTSGGGLTNPLAICGSNQGIKCVQVVLGSVIKTALGIVGSLALLMAVWGGFLWLTSMGNESKVETGKKTLIWSVLGLVLIFGAYALTSFVFSALAPTK